MAKYQEALVSLHIQHEIRRFTNAPFTNNENDIELATEEIANIYNMAAEKAVRKRLIMIKKTKEK